MATEKKSFPSSELKADTTEIINNPVAEITKKRTWRNGGNPSKKFWQSFYNDDEAHMPLFLSPTLQDMLRCSSCRKYLSVGPTFYEHIRHKFYLACGRCFRDPASEVHTHRLLQDHLYEKLLPHFVFKCSYASCEVKLMWNQVEEHEENCTFKSQIEPAIDNVLRDFRNIITMPNRMTFRKTLSCDLCFKPLSVFPVLSNGQQIICGRCASSVVSTGNWTEQLIYSRMSNFLTFFCASAICPQALKTGEVEKHESNCRWTILQCGVNGCRKFKWPVEMSIHIRNHHLQEAIADRLNVVEQRSLFKIESEPYIVAITAVNKNLLCCAVYGLDDMEYGKLTLEIVNEDELVLESSQIQVTKFKQKFESEHGILIDGKRKNSAFLRLVKAKMDNDCSAGVALDEKSSEDLECNVCYCYMTRSIFKCVNEHPICDGCKKRVGRICPMCRARLETNRRHLQLEQEAAKFKFPCRFQETNNCQVELTPEFLTAHEDLQCRRVDNFPFKNCFVAGCAAKFDRYRYNVFFNHCAERHLDSVMYSGGEEVVEWSTEKPRTCDSRVLFFEGELFYIELEFDGNKGLSFGISHMMAPRMKHYKYKLEVHSQWRSWHEINVCHRLDAEPTLFYFEPEVVKDMVNGDLTTAFSGPISGWLEYRVTLEEDKYADVLHIFLFDSSSDDSDNETDDGYSWYSSSQEPDSDRYVTTR